MNVIKAKPARRCLPLLGSLVVVQGLAGLFVEVAGDILKSSHLLYPMYCIRHKV